MTSAAHAVENAPSRSPQRAGRAHATIDHHTPAGTIGLQASADRCACGGGCPRCQAKTDLKIGEPGDVFEREADAMADRIMRMPIPQPAPRHAQPTLQRACDGSCQQHEDDEEPLQVQGKAESASAHAHSAAGASTGIRSVLASAGQPLPGHARNFFESRFGHDFSGVRVHADAAAGRSARDVAARAYTVGRDVVFAPGQFAPETYEGRRLLAHELTHVVQQGAAPRSALTDEPSSATAGEMVHSGNADVVQRAGDPAFIPKGFPCDTDLTPGAPAGTDIVFSVSGFAIDAGHTAQLTTFRDAWLLAGGTDDILIHGYASTDGDQEPNWTLSCNRAEAVRAELLRLGIPAVRIEVVAHGESTDFGAGAAANRHAVVSSSASIFPLPLVAGTLTAADNFAGRSSTRFGVGETVNLDFVSLPPRPAADFGGLEWNLASGGGTLAGVTPAGTATYTAPAATDSSVRLELRVAAGATAGTVVSAHPISIVQPNGVRMVEVPGTAPSFANPGTVPAGTWGAGFQANVFLDPRDVSFQGVVFSEGTIASVVTPAGSFQSPFAGLAHPVSIFGPAHGGNAATGTPVSPPVDNITTGQLASTGTLFGFPTCGTSDFLWAIPWEFTVAGGPLTPFATANHHATSTFFCDATIEKNGAGPFCRRIDGTTC
ncbi:MAG: DUF4157 domain-containing protein [Betaproteobacteria bacterium]|nr:DUF4157 domain-containing protein [Betaproteobacteria bacterium]